MTLMMMKKMDKICLKLYCEGFQMLSNQTANTEKRVIAKMWLQESLVDLVTREWWLIPDVSNKSNHMDILQ